MTDNRTVLRGLPMILAQIARFGFVGVVATFVHAGVFSVLIGVASAPSALANLLGFLAAFAVSFVGHSRFTFRASDAGLTHFRRFLIVALVGLAVNALIVHMVIEVAGLHYMFATAGIVVITPTLTFILAKFYAFR